MEEPNSNSSSTEQVNYLRTPNIPEVQKGVEFVVEHSNDPIALFLSPQTIQGGKSNTFSSAQIQDHSTRNVLDVQNDTDFIMEHLNDPNFDLSNLPSSIPGVDEEFTKIYVSKDDNEDIYFDELVIVYLFFPCLLSNKIP